MGSLLKKSKQASGQKQNSQSPGKRLIAGKLQKAATADVNISKGLGESPQKASPLKKQMLTFEAPDSPQKNVADLNKSTLKPSSVFKEQMTLPQPILNSLK